MLVSALYVTGFAMALAIHAWAIGQDRGRSVTGPTSLVWLSVAMLCICWPLVFATLAIRKLSGGDNDV